MRGSARAFDFYQRVIAISAADLARRQVDRHRTRRVRIIGLIVACAAMQQVSAGPAAEQIIAVAAKQLVIAATAEELVVAAETFDVVGAIIPNRDVIAFRRPGQRVAVRVDPGGGHQDPLLERLSPKRGARHHVIGGVAQWNA